MACTIFICFDLSVFPDDGAMDRMKGEIWRRGTIDRRCLRPPRILILLERHVYLTIAVAHQLFTERAMGVICIFMQNTWEIMRPYQLSWVGGQFRNDVADNPEVTWSYLMIWPFHLFLATLVYSIIYFFYFYHVY